MGWYINPPAQTKESWLLQHGEQTVGPCEITKTHLPVCLVDNGPFTAAAVCPHTREIEDFTYECGRRKQWFRVPRQALADYGFYVE